MSFAAVLPEILVKGDSFPPAGDETVNIGGNAVNSFAFWLDRPFNPRRVPRRSRRTRFVTIRYRGSFGRSVVKTLIVLALLAIMSNVIGERAAGNLGADETAAEVGGAGARR